ncbi:hypothetical protein vBEcoMWL3_gp099c [Escherichia phage vB_EcoM_WL-3]|nr:hypothetical protein vBEcoMWL3_gp099c [Escherichia phage vB_EcoM_WL-3]
MSNSITCVTRINSGNNFLRMENIKHTKISTRAD